MIAKIYAFVIDFRAVQLHEIIFKPIQISEHSM